MLPQLPQDAFLEPTYYQEVPGRELSGIERNGVSNDDKALLDIMLDPAKRNFYNNLVGESPNSEKHPWPEGLQTIAKRGMLDLVAAEFVDHAPIGDTIEDMRVGIWSLNADPDTKAAFARVGRAMSYQNIRRDPNTLKETGDWLHFGVNRSYAGATDLLPSQVRVYVSTAVEHVGRVAATVIRRSMQQGFKPYGKVLDDSSNKNGISTRADKLIVLASTQTQLDRMLDTLGEMQGQHSYLFEDRAPLLAQKTEIEGVSLGDDPMNDGSRLRESFSGMREYILLKAWDSVIDQTMGGNKGDSGCVVIDGQVLDVREVNLQKQVTEGLISKIDVLISFRKAVDDLAPSYGISPDNFARNAA